MTQANQLIPGNTISINKVLYRVDSIVKVSVPKGQPFMKAKLRELLTNKTVEKNFKPTQDIEEVQLQERRLEFLYPEGKEYLFLDIASLDQVMTPATIVGKKISFLKEGIEVKALSYAGSIFSLELPQYLELMVVNIESERSKGASVGGGNVKIAQLETGAKIEVPTFIEVGDIVKIDTRSEEYIQRV